jgi:hypothetical protein
MLPLLTCKQPEDSALSCTPSALERKSACVCTIASAHHVAHGSERRHVRRFWQQHTPATTDCTGGIAHATLLQRRRRGSCLRCAAKSRRWLVAAASSFVVKCNAHSRSHAAGAAQQCWYKPQPCTHRSSLQLQSATCGVIMMSSVPFFCVVCTVCLSRFKLCMFVSHICVSVLGFGRSYCRGSFCCSSESAHCRCCFVCHAVVPACLHVSCSRTRLR